MPGKHAYRDLEVFMSKWGIGHYAEVFFDRGVTAENFHNLTEKELLAMRLTNTTLRRKILRLSDKKENVKHQKVVAMQERQRSGGIHRKAGGCGSKSPGRRAARSPRAASPPHGAAAANQIPRSPPMSPQGDRPPPDNSNHKHYQPTANQCVRKATVYIPPSPARQQKMLDKFKQGAQQGGAAAGASGAAAAAGGHKHSENGDCCEEPHSHGRQSANCKVCSELNLSQKGVDDRDSARRKEELPFPSASAQDPEYPNPHYNYALQFRLLQISINASEFQQSVWTEEEVGRDQVYQDIMDYVIVVKEEKRQALSDVEDAARSALIEGEHVAFKELLKETLEGSSGISLSALDRTHRELLRQQRMCMIHVEVYERQCLDAEEEADMNTLVEVSAHLYHMSAKEQKDRLKEVESLDYRNRCPTCCKKRCTFFQKPWKLWSTRHTVLPEGEEAPKAHRCFSSGNLKALTGGCHGISTAADYAKMYDFNERVKRLKDPASPSSRPRSSQGRKVKKSMPDTLRSTVASSDAGTASHYLKSQNTMSSLGYTDTPPLRPQPPSPKVMSA